MQMNPSPRLPADPIEGPLQDLDAFNKTAFADPRAQVQALLAIERSFLQVPLASNFSDRSKQYVSSLNKIRTRLLDLEKRYAGITGLGEITIPNPHNYFQLVQYKHKTNLGMIWLAINRVTNEPVICKLSRFEDMPRFTDQPQEETKILGELRGHPNVVRVLMDFRHPCDPQFYWCILEYCEQGDLFTYVENADKADLSMCKNLFKQMITGIAFMHSKGLAHMDIKPDNFLLTLSNQGALICKVCDPGMSCRFSTPSKASAAIPPWLAAFGQETLSKIVDVFAAAWHAHAAKTDRNEHVEHDLIMAFPSMAARKHELMTWLLALRGTTEQKDEEPKFRGFRGTNKYMAPEVFCSSNRDTGPFYDPRKADVWSLGIVLFMLLFRGNPWNLPDPSDERFKFIITDTKGEPTRVAQHLQLILQSWNMSCEPPCTQLLSYMLCDAKHRLLLDDIARHPWLREDPSPTEERPPKQVRPNEKKEGK